MSTGEGAQPAEVDEHFALGLGKELKSRKRTTSKASIAKAQPLKVSGSPAAKPDRAFRQAWRKTAGDLSEAEQRQAVLHALEVFRQLPPSSSYAQHRIRVLEKALELLDKASR
jgi:hypothetical protein